MVLQPAFPFRLFLASLAVGLAVCRSIIAQPYTFTTVPGTENIRGAGLDVDESGNIYVAGYTDHVILRITPAGQITIIAGVSGEPGSNDGPALSARFREPRDVAVDVSGNLYVADEGNHAIRRISNDGYVSTLAVFPDRAMPPNGVIFASYPYGIAVDPSGNVFVTDGGHYLVRKISPSGEATVFAGSPVITTGGVDGVGPAARFITPKGCALDFAGNLYVADLGNYAVRKISPGREVTTLAGHLSTSAGDGYFGSAHAGYVDGPPGESRLQGPLGVAVDRHGFVFVADNTRIRRISPTGYVTTIAGGDHQYTPHGIMVPPLTADGTGSEALFASGGDIVIGPDGALYVLNNGLMRGVPSRKEPGSRVINFSVLARADADAGGMIVGFVTSDIFAKRLVIRGIGPLLANFGVSNSVSRLTLRLNRADGSQLSVNTNWAGDAALRTAFARVGAFPLASDSLDAAVVQVVPGTLHTVQLTPEDGPAGVALTEIYDDDPDTPSTRLVNISARARVDADQDLRAGFVIHGTAPKSILVRAVGPTLAAFGLSDVLRQPSLTIFDSARTVLAENARWAGAPNLVDAFTRTGAFPFATDSADSAIRLTLPPGAYTAQVRGVDGASGTTLIEIFEIPEPETRVEPVP